MQSFVVVTVLFGGLRPQTTYPASSVMVLPVSVFTNLCSSSLAAAPWVVAPLEDHVARREDHVGRLAVAWPQEALAATPWGAAQLEDRMAKREDLVGWLAMV